MADHRQRPTMASPLVAATLALAASALLLASRRRPPAAPSQIGGLGEESATGAGRSLLGILPSLADPRSEAPRPPLPLDEPRREQKEPQPPLREAVLTSWLTYRDDPQRSGVRVSPTSIDYMRNLYVSATHLGVPLVVFHNELAPDFIERYANEYVSFVQVTPDPTDSTNDYRFTPYLNYVLEHDLEYVLMVDASDVHFNRDPFEAFRQRGGQNNLFVSRDQGTFYPPAWNVKECYGEQTEGWDPNVPFHNAGVWGGIGEGLRCALQCTVDQLNGPLKGRGRHDNCNMPAVNFCISSAIGPCGPDVISLDPDPIGSGFVAPWKGPAEACLGDEFAVVHNKCIGTSCQSRRKVCPGEDKLCVEVAIDKRLTKAMVPPDSCPEPKWSRR